MMEINFQFWRILGECEPGWIPFGFLVDTHMRKRYNPSIWIPYRG